MLNSENPTVGLINTSSQPLFYKKLIKVFAMNPIIGLSSRNICSLGEYEHFSQITLQYTRNIPLITILIWKNVSDVRLYILYIKHFKVVGKSLYEIILLLSVFQQIV